jgi:hypothetical protein
LSKINYIRKNFHIFCKNKPKVLPWIHQEGLPVHKQFGGNKTYCRAVLYALVKMLKPKNILEIGSWNQKNSNYVINLGLLARDVV